MFNGNIRTYLLVFSLIFGNFLLFSQNPPLKTNDFPQSWVGNWKGELKIYNSTGLKQSLEMELQIHPIEGTENFDWFLIYGPDKVEGKRAYTLKPVDKEFGVWLVDENNGIGLECYLFQNKLYSTYLVGGNMITVTNEVNEEEMIFEIHVGSDEPVSITGGKEIDGEEIPEVKTFPVKGRQYAVLRRE